MMAIVCDGNGLRSNLSMRGETGSSNRWRAGYSSSMRSPKRLAFTRM